MAWFSIAPFVVFFIGLLLLGKGADYFVRGGSGLATRLQISKTLLGFTIISAPRFRSLSSTSMRSFWIPPR